jgi:hypothetical protein
VAFKKAKQTVEQREQAIKARHDLNSLDFSPPELQRQGAALAG